MRKVASLALLAVLGNCAPAAAHYLSFCESPQQPEFNLNECATRATHILVVDRCGKVVDVWKGRAELGQTVPLDKFFSPVLPRLMDAPIAWQFARTDTWYCWLDRIQARDRNILFLVKSRQPLPSATTLMDKNEEGQFSRGAYVIEPAERIARRIASDGWLPASQTGGFVCSMAYIDDIGLVRARRMVHLFRPRFNCEPGDNDPVPMWDIISTEESFRWQVNEAIMGYGPDGR